MSTSAVASYKTAGRFVEVDNFLFILCCELCQSCNRSSRILVLQGATGVKKGMFMIDVATPPRDNLFKFAPYSNVNDGCRESFHITDK